MQIVINGSSHDCEAQTLAALLDQLGYAQASVATAINGEFVPRSTRSDVLLADGMQIDIVAPIQGG